MSESLTFNYFMPRQNVELTARLEYSPASPAEPGSDGSQSGNIDNGGQKGDVNADGMVNTADAVMTINDYVNTADAVAIINAYVSGNIDSLTKSVADVNEDGIVNTADAVMTINDYVNGK